MLVFRRIGCPKRHCRPDEIPIVTSEIVTSEIVTSEIVTSEIVKSPAPC
ncbi:MAG: hypothetical protein J6X67_13830 [Treponema sp.]|nr:hypothetical protein [Treponema sp.]MBP5747696.1 hypothetical protein [Treponema sp.]